MRLVAFVLRCAPLELVRGSRGIVRGLVRFVGVAPVWLGSVALNFRLCALFAVWGVFLCGVEWLRGLCGVFVALSRSAPLVRDAVR